MTRQRTHLEEWASLLDERVSEDALDEGRRERRTDRPDPQRGG
ncbi:hypothetical protein [Halosimplex halophilum]|nr:hypothetical protein [Halosimplex halophilum]